MTLLEREEYLSALTSQFRKAVSGEGQVAVICGDAGIGKTSLVESFTKQYENKAKVYNTRLRISVALQFYLKSFSKTGHLLNLGVYPHRLQNCLR